MLKHLTRKGTGYLVVCPGCKKSYHKTTDKFKASDKVHNGSMFELMAKYGRKGMNWSTFPSNKGMTRGDLECPNCGACYCKNNRVTVIPDPSLLKCPHCGEVFKNAAGRAAHVRMKHAKTRT